MATLKLKPGVVTGSALQELFAYCKEAKCALPAVNVIGSHTANAAMEAAREAKAPIIIQLSQSGSAFYAGKFIDNAAQQGSIAGSIAGALHVRSMAAVYGVPVVLHTDHCAAKLLPWVDGVLTAGEEYFAKNGEPLPESMRKGLRFAFIKPTAKVWASQRPFRQYGQSGMQFSDWMPHMATCADDLCMVRSMYSDQFNHHPGQLLMQCGRASFGLPCMGSWLTYGLGSESQNLPGYVVLTAGRGSSGGASLWQSGFLPSAYSGVLFRNKGEAVLNLQNPPGISRKLQRQGLDALARVNQTRFQEIRDPEIASRIASYELAYKMQQYAPEAVDFSQETEATQKLYGLDQSKTGSPSVQP